jgi:hypothetical protein
MYRIIKIELHKKEGSKPHSFSTMVEIPEGTTAEQLTESIKTKVESVMNCSTTSITVKMGKEDLKQDWVLLPNKSINDDIKAKIIQ